MVGQVSMALIILIASGLMVRSFALINAAGVGFNPADLTVLELPFPRNYSRSTGQNTPAGGLLVEFDSRFTDDSEAVIERLSSLPGVRSVSATATPPLGGVAPRVGVLLSGEALQPSERTALTAEWYPVSPRYCVGARSIREIVLRHAPLPSSTRRWRSVFGRGRTPSASYSRPM